MHYMGGHHFPSYACLPHQKAFDSCPSVLVVHTLSESQAAGTLSKSCVLLQQQVIKIVCELPFFKNQENKISVKTTNVIKEVIYNSWLQFAKRYY